MNILEGRRFYRHPRYLFPMEESFIINGEVVIFVENTKTHRVRIIWDKDELETSLAKAKAIHDFLTAFCNEKK